MYAFELKRFCALAKLVLPALLLVVIDAGTKPAAAHPHVFVEANVDIVRDAEGNATEIRHVWRFDEFFTTSLILDFDKDGNGHLDREDLDEISKITRSSLAEFNYYTEIRKNTEIIEFFEPDPYLLEVRDNQLIMILALKLREPTPIGASGFKLAVSDPTYYVAVEFVDENAVQVTGAGGSCKTEIVPPDFDALWERDAERMEELFAAGADEDVEASDDYLTWINLECRA